MSMEDWGAVRARLADAVEGVTSDEYFVEVQPADIRAALERVEELERGIDREGLVVTLEAHEAEMARAEAAEAKLAEMRCVSCDGPLPILCRECARQEFERARCDRDEAISQCVSIGRESKKLEAKLARCVEALELLLLPIRPLLSDEPHERRIPTQHDVLVIRQARAALAATKGGE